MSYACKVKICGMRRDEDIEFANLCLPDYIGFVFAESRRRIGPGRAEDLKRRLDPKILAVGGCVNSGIESILELCSEGIVDLIQLHGDEDDEYIGELRMKTNIPVIKAFSVGGDPIDADSCPAEYLLFDAPGRSSRGGSGKVFDWSEIAAVKRPYFLAGGLDASNIAMAIERLRPYGIDVSSGAETDGEKDLEKMSGIIKAAKEKMIL